MSLEILLFILEKILKNIYAWYRMIVIFRYQVIIQLAHIMVTQFKGLILLIIY